MKMTMNIAATNYGVELYGKHVSQYLDALAALLMRASAMDATQSISDRLRAAYGFGAPLMTDMTLDADYQLISHIVDDDGTRDEPLKPIGMVRNADAFILMYPCEIICVLESFGGSVDEKTFDSPIVFRID